MDPGAFSPGVILALVVVVALLPYAAVMITAFTKLVVVFSLLRNALGLQQTPPNVVINGLAIILTVYVMYPVGMQMTGAANNHIQASAQPLDVNDVNQIVELAQIASEPLRAFLIQQTTDDERQFFLETIRQMAPVENDQPISEHDLIVIVPAFTVSELTRAFQIGFIIFLPFLVLDLIVSNVLQALCMMMLAPTTISLPLKLLLFVMLDGWSKLIHGLVLTY